MRALDRDHVAGLLDHADQPGVAARVLAELAARALGQVEAHLAQADLLGDLADGVGERERLVVVGAQQVERKPLGRPGADARQLAQLGDEPLDRRGVQGATCRAGRGRPARP